MLKTRIAKVAGLAVGATVLFGAFVPMAGAVTVAELQAQINALMAQLAALQGGSTVSAGTQINSDLTVGSTGADVTALQSALVAQGHLVMPAGVSMGYFGSLTRAAVMKWQAANGIINTGYFGPLSRAKFNASASTGTTGTVPGTTVTGGTTVVGAITTPGVEGTLTVSENASPASGTKLYEGDTKRGVMGIKLEADNSDIRIERVKIDLDSITNSGDNLVYTKIADKIHVMDGSTVLASSDLNSNTVVKDGSDYFITISGLSFVVPKGATKVLTIALDAKPSWDSTYDGDSWSLGVPVDGVRGVDGAGINQYGPTTAFSNSFDTAGDIVDSATLTVSTNASTPQKQQKICTSGTDEDECDELELLKADFRAEKDAVTVTDLVVDINMTDADTATATTAYLYDGSTLIGSDAIEELTGANSATFADIDWVVPKDTTKTLSVRVDIRDAKAAANDFAADIDTADVTAENSAGTGITESGSATGKTITIRSVGPEITLVSKSITTSGVPQSDTTNSLSTSTLSSTFNVKIKAVGGALTLGTVASGTPLFASSTTSFKVYRNGSYDGTLSAGATSTSYSIPNTCVTAVGANGCNLAENAEVTIPVTFQIIGRTVGGVSLTRGSVYAIGLEGLTYYASGSSYTEDFMAGENDWRTADVSFP